MPLPFQSRYCVTGHPRAETAATVNESAPFPALVSVCAKTAVAPGAPLMARGGCSVTPATCPTRSATVSEARVYPVPAKLKDRVAQLETWVPACVPWASSAGAARSPKAKRKAAAQRAAARPRRAHRPLSTVRVPSRMGRRPLVDADPQLERGAGARRQNAARARVIPGHVLPAHRDAPTGARARRDIGHLRRQRVGHLHAGCGGAAVIGHGEPVADDLRSEEHTSELQSPCNLVCRLLLEKKKKRKNKNVTNIE